jgi:hypothetical protein
MEGTMKRSTPAAIGNDATERDASWTPLNDTPMHPEYPSQAAMGEKIAAYLIANSLKPIR